jgi:hypothetical protein
MDLPINEYLHFKPIENGIETQDLRVMNRIIKTYKIDFQYFKIKKVNILPI